jgi:hypothetical protein
VSDEKLDGGRRWIIETLYRIAQEESVEIDDPPEWEVDGLYWKLALQVGDRRQILKLWRPNVDDVDGAKGEATASVRSKVEDELRGFIGLFTPPRRNIGFV